MKKYMLLMVSALLFAFGYAGGDILTSSPTLTAAQVGHNTAGAPTLVTSVATGAYAAVLIDDTHKAVVPSKYAILQRKKTLPKAVLLAYAAGFRIPLYKEYAERWRSSEPQSKDLTNYLIARNRTTRCYSLWS